MKIGLIGYGKMGRAVEYVALEKGHEVVERIDSKKTDFSALKKADICLDFTAPQAVWKNLEKLACLKKNVIIGTTGWEVDFPKAKKLASKTPFGLLYAPNFSIGIYILKKLIHQSKKLTKPFGFDVAGIEMHHKQKKDQPSGTACDISGIPFASLRCGDLFGIHQVIFNAGDDTIELTHRASSRKGFAMGVIAAAEWMKDKIGVWTFDDFMKDRLCN